MPATVARRITNASQDEIVLSKAVSRAAALWGISNATLGKIIGVSEATGQRLRSGSWHLEYGKKPFELSQLFARVFRSLDAMMGSDDEASKSWLESQNSDLGDRPIELITSVRGLVRVADYIDDFRGRA